MILAFLLKTSCCIASTGTIVNEGEKGTKLNIDFSKRKHGYLVAGGKKVEGGVAFPGGRDGESIWKPKQLEAEPEPESCGCEGPSGCVVN
eukprot:1191390-Prorocentrum_minimum.AAC.6